MKKIIFHILLILFALQSNAQKSNFAHIINPAANELKTHLVFKTFPNPFNSEIHFTLSSAANEVVSYRILSLQGSEILSGKLNGFEGVVYVGNISEGTYFFELTFSDGSCG